MVKIMENPIKIDDLGVPLFLETPKWANEIGWIGCPMRFIISNDIISNEPNEESKKSDPQDPPKMDPEKT